MTQSSSSPAPSTLLARAPLAHAPEHYLSKAVHGHAQLAATVDAHLVTAFARRQEAITAAQLAGDGGR